MPGQAIKIGPWPKGLNLNSDLRTIDRQSLYNCINFDLTDEGYLFPRRSFTTTSTSAFTIGNFVDFNGNTSCLIGVLTGGGGSYHTTFGVLTRDGTVSMTTVVLNTSTAPVFLGYIEYLGIGCIAVQNLGLYTFHGCFGQGTAITPTLITGSPTGAIIGIINQRLFMHNSDLDIVHGTTTQNSTISYSKTSDFATWTVPDGGSFDVDKEANGKVTASVISNNNIYLFKPHSSFVFSFSADPANDGTLVKISDVQGASSAVILKNQIYLADTKSVYRLINNQFIDVAAQMYFTGATVSKLVVLGDRIIYFPTTSNFVYCLNPMLNSWTQYILTDNVNPSYPFADLISPSLTPAQLVMTSSNGNLVICNTKTTPVVNSGFDFNPSSPELFNLSLTTGIFDGGSTYDWKRLYWWSLEGDIVYSLTQPELSIYINNSAGLGTQVVTDTQGTNTFGRVATKSVRFQNIAFNYGIAGMQAPYSTIAYSYAYTDTNINALSNWRPTITGLTIYVAKKEHTTAN